MSIMGIDTPGLQTGRAGLAIHPERLAYFNRCPDHTYPFRCSMSLIVHTQRGRMASAEHISRIDSKLQQKKNQQQQLT